MKKYNRTKNLGKYAKKGFATGSKNPFYGETHTEASKEKIRNRDKSFFKTKAYKDKVSANTKGCKNPMYGKTYYQIWVEKYGKDKADELQKNKNIKTSLQVSGAGNPMYGKPTPQGSGNGWSGWYKGWFFRSLKELSYVIDTEKNGKLWKSAESLGIKIPYLGPNGQQRNYTPDFLIDSQELIEVKPKKLHETLLVKTKKEAAERYAKNNGLTYRLTDAPEITKNDIKVLHDNKTIKFTKKYEVKYQSYILGGL